MIIKKLNQLEKCKLKGWLDFGDERITSLDRLQAGQRLWTDFVKSALPSPKAINFEADHVDGGNMKQMPESVAMARQRFHEAIRSIKYYPAWFMVRTIVLEDRKVVIRGVSKRQHNHEIEMLKGDLCRGLDTLAWHYGINPAKPHIVSYTTTEEDFIETPNRYTIEI